MKIEKLKPFPPNTNPYLHDMERMGINISHGEDYGWEIMYHSDKNKIIVVDKITGERIKIIREVKIKHIKKTIITKKGNNTKWPPPCLQ